jgi:cell division protein FtsL
MTTVAAAPHRAAAPRRAPASSRAPRSPAAKPQLRVAPARERTGSIGTVLALATLFALISAVVFHVVLAQNQMQLDRLNGQIAKEQRAYEHNRLTTSQLSSPQRIIQEAERLGMVPPAAPPQYLRVPGAPRPAADGEATATTLDDWSKAKSSLGDQQP